MSTWVPYGEFMAYDWDPFMAPHDSGQVAKVWALRLRGKVHRGGAPPTRLRKGTLSGRKAKMTTALNTASSSATHSAASRAKRIFPCGGAPALRRRCGLTPHSRGMARGCRPTSRARRARAQRRLVPLAPLSRTPWIIARAPRGAVSPAPRSRGRGNAARARAGDRDEHRARASAESYGDWTGVGDVPPPCAIGVDPDRDGAGRGGRVRPVPGRG